MATRKTPKTKTVAKPNGKAKLAAKASAKRGTHRVATATAKPKVVTRAKAAPKVKQPTKIELLGPQVVELRKQGVTFKQIARQLKSRLPQVVLAHKVATVKPSEKFTGTRDEVTLQIVAARDNQFMSWQDLQARTGFSNSTIKKLYADATGKNANQGFDVMRQMIAAKQATKGAAVKTRTKTGQKVTPKAKHAVAAKARKSAKGSTNPSKG